jgi:hypothetical protein
MATLFYLYAQYWQRLVAWRNVSRGFGHPFGEFSVARQCRTSLSARALAG